MSDIIPTQRRRYYRLPLVLQEELAECGHACVAMIAHFWGHRVSIASLRHRVEPSACGVTLRTLERLCEQLKLQTRALQVSIDALHLVKCPAILHCKTQHFVVLKAIRKNEAIIHDPAVGERRCTREEAAQLFSGVVLEVEPCLDFTPVQESKRLRLRDLLRAIPQRYVFITVLFTLSSVIECLGLANPLLMQYITDDVISTHDAQNLTVIAIGFGLLVLFQHVVEFFRNHLLIYVSNEMNEKFSSNVMEHLLRLPLSFFAKRHKGDIQSRFFALDQLQKKLSRDFITTLFDGVLIVLYLFIMLFYSPILTGCVLVSSSLYMGVRAVSYRSFKSHMESSVTYHAYASSIFLETLHHIVSVKSFFKESLRAGVWRNTYLNALNADLTTAKVQAVYQLIQQLLFAIEHIVVLSVGARLVITHQFSVGMLLAFLAYRLVFVNKSAHVMQQIFEYCLLSIPLSRLGDILVQTSEKEDETPVLLPSFTGVLSLKNVSFAYSNVDKPLFTHVNLEVTPGEKIVITGPSGCGKSTLLKVMMGLLPASNGNIYLDGYDVRDLGIQRYRQFIAAVMQEDTLLRGSIIENITFFDEVIDLERLYYVTALACMHDTIIRFPMGYKTQVGDSGGLLSGGQKQRLLLARALYQQPKFLFLDEATSHLDVQNERQINTFLRELAITQIVIAHREETIRMADRVIDFTMFVEAS